MVDFARDFGSGKTHPSREPITLTFGRVVMTPAANNYIEKFHIDYKTILRRFASGDWGEVDPEDAAQNDRVVRAGQGMVLASYPRVPGKNEPGDDRLWIIHYPETGDTTILLPEDY